MKLSVVIPAYNEAENIARTVYEILTLARRLPDISNPEVIVVDDHSSDDTYGCVARLERPNVKCIRLSRRFGSHTALRAGMAKAKGDAVLCISADGQDDSSCLEGMLKKWEGGAAVVWALRYDRKKESWYIRKPAELFYRILFSLLNVKGSKIDLSRADFFLLDRIIVDAINACPERNTSLLGMIAWMGFNQDFVEYDRRKRMAGSSKWSLRSRFRLAMNWIIAFSGVPLKIASLAGITMSVLGALGAVYIVIDSLFFSNIVAGWTTVVVLILLLSGIQLTILGIVGEYLWRNLDESRRRPLYFIEAATKDADRNDS